MYVLIDIIILIYHWAAWSRLLAKVTNIPTEPPVWQRNTERKGGQMVSLTVALKTYRKRINTLHFLAIPSASYSLKCSHFRSFTTHYSHSWCPPNQLPYIAWNLAPALESHWHTCMDHIQQVSLWILVSGTTLLVEFTEVIRRNSVTPFLGSKIVYAQALQKSKRWLETSKGWRDCRTPKTLQGQMNAGLHGRHSKQELGFSKNMTLCTRGVKN